MRDGSLSPAQVKRIVHDLRYRILPELQKEYLQAHDYIAGRKDRPSDDQHDYVTGGGEHSDPTGDTAVEQMTNAQRLKSASDSLRTVEADLLGAKDALKRVFDVSEQGPLEAVRLSSADEEFSRRQAVKLREKQSLLDERKQLERRQDQIDKLLREAG